MSLSEAAVCGFLSQFFERNVLAELELLQSRAIIEFWVNNYERKGRGRVLAQPIDSACSETPKTVEFFAVGAK